MRKTYRRKKEKPKFAFKKNEEIRSPEVLLIDEENGTQERKSLKEALEIAEERNCDLVEVSPKANPPVARLMDYGKFMYQKEKLMQKQKAKLKKIEVKGIRLSLRISDHDRNLKQDQSKKFLEKGHKVKIEMQLRGREHQHTHVGKEMIQKFIDEINEDNTVEIESPIQKQGGKIMTIIYKKQ